MNTQKQSLQELQQIKSMMERSSKFISLSGLSGISAGVCALVGAWFAHRKIYSNNYESSEANLLTTQLLYIAAAVFILAFISAFFFTYLRSRKDGVPIWGTSSKRVMINVTIPLIVGGLFVIKLIQIGANGLIAPACLIFYGLALVNAGKYTLGEVRYLGYLQIVLGLINLWMIGYGLYFWAAGFGLLHIVYGVIMWYKYERVNSNIK